MINFPNKPKLEDKSKIQSGKNIHGIKLSLSLKLEYQISKIYSELKITYTYWTNIMSVIWILPFSKYSISKANNFYTLKANRIRKIWFWCQHLGVYMEH